MVTEKTNKILHIFFGLVALIAGIINAFSNIYYPCALTLIPAGFLYLMGAYQNRELWNQAETQVLLLTIGIGIIYAGVWELLILTSWNDLLHIFMLLTGIYFCSAITFEENSALYGILGGIGFIVFIRLAYVTGLFSLSLQLKIPALQEIGSWYLAIIITSVLVSLNLYRSKVISSKKE